MKTLVIELLLCLTAQTQGPEAQVLEAMQPTLPIDLVATDVRILGRSDWSSRAQLTVNWRRAVRPGRRTAEVSVVDGGDRFRTWASVELATLRPSVVTTRPLRMGDTVRAGDLEVALRPVPAHRALDIAPEALVGQPVLRELDRGAVIGKRDIGLSPPVARGTTVKVVSRVGAASVVISGVLVASVRVGERGKVRVPVSRRALPGRLVSAERFVLEVR